MFFGLSHIANKFLRGFLAVLILLSFSNISFIYAEMPIPAQNTEKAFLETTYQKWRSYTPINTPGADFSDTYLLGADDILNIGIPDFYFNDASSSVRSTSRQPAAINGEFKIGNAGELAIPVLGTYFVDNMTTSQVRGMITEMASYYLVNPSVSVTLKSHRAYSIYVVGSVKRPGVYQLPPTTNSVVYNLVGATNSTVGDYENYSPTVSSAIKRAGGIEQYADIRNIVVDNKYTGKHVVVDLHKMAAEGDSSQDIRLDPNDVVKIGRVNDSILQDRDVAMSNLAPMQYYVRIVGYANKNYTNSQIGLTPDRMTLLDAMAQVSFGSDINTKRAVVLRKIPDQNAFERFDVNPYKLPFNLEPGDTVVFTDLHTMARVKDIVQVLSQIVLPMTVLVRK